jgi:hypothetical protein
MTEKNRDRIYSTARQSFSHGRSRVVQVEIIPSNQPRSKKKRRRKEKKVASPAATAAALSTAKTSGGHKVRERRDDKGNRSTLSSKPPFFNSASAVACIPSADMANSPKKGPSGGARKGGGGTFGKPSAGLPGNEHVDPPVRRSPSTAADRWRAQLNRNR